MEADGKNQEKRGGMAWDNERMQCQWNVAKRMVRITRRQFNTYRNTVGRVRKAAMEDQQSHKKQNGKRKVNQGWTEVITDTSYAGRDSNQGTSTNGGVQIYAKLVVETGSPRITMDAGYPEDILLNLIAILMKQCLI
jgi:hypothetical protein